MAKRKLYVGERPQESSRVDMITTRVRPVVVEQMGSWPPFAIVQASGYTGRPPRWTDENALLRRALKTFEATVYSIPEGHKWCGTCGDVRRKDRFTADRRNRDGLHSTCNYCRAEHSRRMYWQAKELKAA